MLERMKGKWALVTGASSGIGSEFCVQLAERGLHLVMVARRELPLTTLADELAVRCGVRTLALAMDLTQPDPGAEIRRRLDEHNVAVSLLVNNAGVGSWGVFDRPRGEAYRQVIEVNAAALVSMCCHFQADLSTSSPAAVINVSSQAALQPVPFMAVYAASKAFVQSFSLALFEEWRGSGIEVQTLIPGPSDTEFDRKAGAYASALTHRDDPAKAVRASLHALGQGRPIVASVGGTYGQRAFAALAPSAMVLRTVAKMFQPKG